MECLYKKSSAIRLRQVFARDQKSNRQVMDRLQMKVPKRLRNNLDSDHVRVEERCLQLSQR